MVETRHAVSREVQGTEAGQPAAQREVAGGGEAQDGEGLTRGEERGDRRDLVARARQAREEGLVQALLGRLRRGRRQPFVARVEDGVAEEGEREGRGRAGRRAGAQLREDGEGGDVDDLVPQQERALPVVRVGEGGEGQELEQTVAGDEEAPARDLAGDRAEQVPGEHEGRVRVGGGRRGRVRRARDARADGAGERLQDLAVR